MVKKDKNGWISVKDHLPEDPDTLVLVTVNGKPQKNITLCGAYHLATYSEQEGWILEGFEDWMDFTVSFWRELPPPPHKQRAEIKV